MSLLLGGCSSGSIAWTIPKGSDCLPLSLSSLLCLSVSLHNLSQPDCDTCSTQARDGPHPRGSDSVSSHVSFVSSHAPCRPF